MLLYYITDRRQFPGNESQRQSLLLEKISEAAGCGVDFIQLREKDLPARDLEKLAGQAQLRTGNREPGTKLLINARVDIAIISDAAGVHLPSNEISPEEVKKIWAACGAVAPAREPRRQKPTITISCHSENEVIQAANRGVDAVLFAPVFEKQGQQGVGLESLRQACRHKIPVLALGGVTLENAAASLQAGAAGIAAIRLFQQGDISKTVEKLRALTS